MASRIGGTLEILHTHKEPQIHIFTAMPLCRCTVDVD